MSTGIYRLVSSWALIAALGLIVLPAAAQACDGQETLRPPTSSVSVLIDPDG